MSRSWRFHSREPNPERGEGRAIMMTQNNLAYVSLWLAGIIMVGELVMVLITTSEVSIFPIAVCLALAAIGVLILMFGPDEPERGSSSEPPKHRPPEA